MIRSSSKQKRVGIALALILCFLAVPAFSATVTLTGVTPSDAATGRSISIYGTGFGASQGASTVTFGTTVAAPSSSWKDTQIYVLVPPNLNPGPITLKVTVGGVSSTEGFIVDPKDYSVAPTAGSVGDSVTISGDSYGADPGVGNRSTVNNHVIFTDLSGANKVQVPTAGVTSWSQNQIICVVPAGVKAGNMQVEVFAAGRQSASPDIVFTVNPKITNISPSTGKIGTTVTIEGTSFGTTGTVAFGGVPADIISWSDTQIVCKVPAGASSGDVTVNSNGATSAGFSFIVPPPVITSVAPAAGPYGTAPSTTYLDIYGSGFGDSQGNSTVSMPAAGNFTPVFWSDTRIVVPVIKQGYLVPGGSQDVTVTINGVPTTEGQAFTPLSGLMIDNYEDNNTVYNTPYSSGAGNGEVTMVPALATDQYYDGQNSVKVIYSKSVGSQWGGYWGRNLKNNATIDLSSYNMLVFRVKGDGSANTVRLDLTGANGETYSSLDTCPLTDSSGFKEFKIPFSRLLKSADAGSLKAITGYTLVYQGSAASSAYNYIDFVSAMNWTGPVIDQIGPNSGPAGSVITITGSGFGATPGASLVKINGVPKQEIEGSWSDTKIMVPVGADSGLVTVTVGGLTSNGVPFTLTPPLSAAGPTITGITPPNGNTGDQVTITGTNLGNDPGAGNRATILNHVAFGNAEAIETDFVSWSATQIVVKVPSQESDGTPISAGICQVQVTSGSVASNLYAFTVGSTPLTPTFSSISPSIGGPGDSLAVTITGSNTNFTNSSAVDFGTSDIKVSGISATDNTHITCNISIDAAAAFGARNVVVTSGSEIITGEGAFNVAVTPVVNSVEPAAGPGSDNVPFTTYVIIKGDHFGTSQSGTSHVRFNSTYAGQAISWTDKMIIMPLPGPRGSIMPGSTLFVEVDVLGMHSNADKTFTPVAGQMIDNFEDDYNGVSPYSYYPLTTDAGAAPLAWTKTTDFSYDGQYSMRAMYPGAVGSQWGGYWGGALNTAVPPLDLSSCNMFVFRLKGDGSSNTIQLGVTESGAAAKAEPYVSLDKYTLSNNSGFQEVKIPFSRLWRNEYTGSVKDDDIFSKSISSYTFNYYGTNTNAAYNYVDFVTAVHWTGPIIDQIGPTSGKYGDMVTIEGSGFGATPGSVFFNGFPAGTYSWTDTKITTSVSSSHAGGLVTVMVGDQVSNGVPFTLTTDVSTLPTITGISPEASGKSGDTLKIIGLNFGDDPRIGYRSTISNHVVFGTVKVTDVNVISWGPTEIDVKVPYDDAGQPLSGGIYPVQVTATPQGSNATLASNLFDFTVIGPVTGTGPVSNISITREADAVGSNIGLSWTCSTGNVDIYTLTGTFETTTLATWTKEFTNVSGTSQIDSSVAGKVASGTNKWYKIVPTGATLATTDLTQEVLGKYDYALKADYNMISLPIKPFNTNPSVVIGNQLTGGTPLTGDQIQAFVAGGWQTCFLNATGSWQGALTAIDSDLGYWIYIRSPHAAKTISIVGKTVPANRTITLSNGYNLIGTAYPVSVTLNSLGLTAALGFTEGTPITADKITSFNGTSYDTSYLSSSTHLWQSANLNSLMPGSAYYIYKQATGDIVWTYVKPY